MRRGEEGEKRTKVGHSVGRAGIGGNVYLDVDGWESLPSPFLSLSRSASVFHMFRFLSRRERQHMGPNFHPTALSLSHPISQSTSVVAAAAEATWNSIEKKRKTQWAECWNRPSGGEAAVFFRLFLTDRVNCRWRRRQCGSGGTSFTMGIAAFSDKSAKRGAAFVTKSRL